MHSAGQIRDRARLLELRAAEEVVQVRQELDPAVADLLFADDKLVTLTDQLFATPPAMTDGFQLPRTPAFPRTLPNLSLFQDVTPIEAPTAFNDEVLNDALTRETFLLPELDGMSRAEQSRAYEPSSRT